MHRVPRTVSVVRIVSQYENVVAGTAVEDIVLEVTVDRIVSVIALQVVPVLPAAKDILTGSTIAGVGAHVSVQEVVSFITPEHVPLLAQVNGVCACPARLPYALALPAKDGVVAGTAFKPVSPGIAVDGVVTRSTIDVVAIIGAVIYPAPLVSLRVVPVGPVDAVSLQDIVTVSTGDRVVAKVALDRVGAVTTGKCVSAGSAEDGPTRR